MRRPLSACWCLHAVQSFASVLLTTADAAPLGCEGAARTAGCVDWDAEALLQMALDTPRRALEIPEIQPGNTSTPYRHTLTNVGDAHYIAHMTLGRQAIAAILDTGSFELVVFGTECENCGVLTHYDAMHSQTYAEGLFTAEQRYLQERLTSVAAHDHLSFGPFSVANQSFLHVRHADMLGLPQASYDAIIGIGPPETSMANAWKAADSMLLNVSAYYDLGMQAPEAKAVEATTQVKIAAEVSKHLPLLWNLNITTFSVCLGSTPGSDGVFVWNDVSAVQRPALFGRVPVTGEHTWSANISDARFVHGGTNHSVMLNCDGGCSALLDTGTSLLAVPSFVLEGLREKMKLLDASCSNLEVLPDIRFSLGRVPVSLPPSSYVARVLGDKAPAVERFAPHLFDQKPCQLLLVETSAHAGGSPLWILGVPFFRSYYTSFEIGTNNSERSLFISQHGRTNCTPLGTASAEIGSEPSLRSVEADKIRLPQTLQIAATERSVSL